MKRYLITVTSVFLLISSYLGCTKNTFIDDKNVLQIRNVGLRQGVFVRRYRMTGEFKAAKTISVDELKDYFNRKLKADYLIIQDAYEKGIADQPVIKQSLKDYKINLLASNHPGNTKENVILKTGLQALYEKKAVKYDLEMVQANSYTLADSMKKFLKQGGKFPNLDEEKQQTQFPKFYQLKEITFGERMHPEMLPVLEKMTQGDISEPIYTAPTWTIICVKNIQRNKDLPEFKDCEKNLLMETEAIQKYQQQKVYTDSLRLKYKISVEKDLYKKLQSAFTQMGDGGYLAKNKLTKDILSKAFIKVGDEEIIVDHFISNFNKSNQYLALKNLSDPDLEQFVNDFAVQYLLYLDSLDKGVQKQEFVEDQLINKEHRTLYAEYLKQEIADKVVVDDATAKEYYVKTKDKWQGTFEQLTTNVKSELKNKLMIERRDAIIAELDKKYKIKFNELLLAKLAESLNMEKTSKK